MAVGRRNECREPHQQNDGYLFGCYSVHQKVSANLLLNVQCCFIFQHMKKHIHNPESQAFAARLRHAMKEAGLKSSATQLADAFNMRYWGVGITPHAARNWMIGASIPKQDKLKTLSDLLQISPHDLLFGPQTSSMPLNEPSQTQSMGMCDTEMMRQFMRLNAEHKRMVRHWVKLAFLSEKNGGVDNTFPLSDNPGSVS